MTVRRVQLPLLPAFPLQEEFTLALESLQPAPAVRVRAPFWRANSRTVHPTRYGAVPGRRGIPVRKMPRIGHPALRSVRPCPEGWRKSDPGFRRGTPQTVESGSPIPVRRKDGYQRRIGGGCGLEPHPAPAAQDADLDAPHADAEGRLSTVQTERRSSTGTPNSSPAKLIGAVRTGNPRNLADSRRQWNSVLGVLRTRPGAIRGSEPVILVTTFSRIVETLLLKSFHGRLPQKVMDPAENTDPPAGRSKYTMSARNRLPVGSPGQLVKWVSCSS